MALYCSAPGVSVCTSHPPLPLSCRYLDWPCRPRCARPSYPRRVFEEVGLAVVCLCLFLLPLLHQAVQLRCSLAAFKSSSLFLLCNRASLLYRSVLFWFADRTACSGELAQVSLSFSLRRHECLHGYMNVTYRRKIFESSFYLELRKNQTQSIWRMPRLMVSIIGKIFESSF